MDGQDVSTAAEGGILVGEQHHQHQQQQQQQQTRTMEEDHHHSTYQQPQEEEVGQKEQEQQQLLLHPPPSQDGAVARTEEFYYGTRDGHPHPHHPHHHHQQQQHLDHAGVEVDTPAAMVHGHIVHHHHHQHHVQQPNEQLNTQTDHRHLHQQEQEKEQEQEQQQEQTVSTHHNVHTENRHPVEEQQDRNTRQLHEQQQQQQQQQQYVEADVQQHDQNHHRHDHTTHDEVDGGMVHHHYQHNTSGNGGGSNDNDSKAINKWSKNGYGAPVGKQSGKFTREESDAVRRAVQEYCAARSIPTSRLCSECDHKSDLKGAWMEIARRLPHRSVQSVYRHGIRQLHPFRRGAWSEAECRALADLVQRVGKKWSAIQAKLNRSADSCRDKYREMSDEYVKGRWKDHETELLKEAIRGELGVDSSIDMKELGKLVKEQDIQIPWSDISKRMGKRSRLSCFKKWQKLTGLTGTGDLEDEDDGDGGMGTSPAADNDNNNNNNNNSNNVSVGTSVEAAGNGQGIADVILGADDNDQKRRTVADAIPNGAVDETGYYNQDGTVGPNSNKRFKAGIDDVMDGRQEEQHHHQRHPLTCAEPSAADAGASISAVEASARQHHLQHQDENHHQHHVQNPNERSLYQQQQQHHTAAHHQQTDSSQDYDDVYSAKIAAETVEAVDLPDTDALVTVRDATIQ